MALTSGKRLTDAYRSILLHGPRQTNTKAGHHEVPKRFERYRRPAKPSSADPRAVVYPVAMKDDGILVYEYRAIECFDARRPRHMNVESFVYEVFREDVCNRNSTPEFRWQLGLGRSPIGIDP